MVRWGLISTVLSHLRALDLPGMSSALITAERLGLPKSIVARAGDLIDPNQREIQKQLTKLDTLQSELEANRNRLVLAEAEVNRRQAELHKKETKLNNKLQQLKDRTHTSILQEAQALRAAVRLK